MNARLFSMMRALLAAALLCTAQVAPAHRFHAGMTEISFNERSGALEIVHTLMAHDVDAMLARRHQRQLDLATPEDEALLRQYVEQRFLCWAQTARHWRHAGLAHRSMSTRW